MKYSNTIICSLLISFSAQAVEPLSLSAALSGLRQVTSQAGDESRRAQENRERRSATRSTTRVESCEETSQKTIPIEVFQALLLQPQEIHLSNDPRRETLTIDAGRMIGNCNSMIRPTIISPAAGRPYLFQIDIRACPESEDGKCEYTVQTKGTGTEIIPVQHRFAPNLDGFIECLQTANVLGANANTDSIVPERAKFEGDNIEGGANLLFASHGSYSSGQERSVLENSGCYHYANLSDESYYVKTVADIVSERLNQEFQAMCRSTDYLQVSESVSQFSGEMQAQLREHAKKLLETELRRVVDLLDRNDISDIDVEYVDQIIDDYFETVIMPKVAEIRRLEEDYDTATRDERSAIEERIKLLSRQIHESASRPNLTPRDLERMQDLERGAPMDNSTWANAVLNLNRNLRYANEYGKFRDGISRDTPNTEDMDRVIRDDQRDFGRLVNGRLRIARDGDHYESERAARSRNDIGEEIMEVRQSAQRAIQEEQMAIAQVCSSSQYMQSQADSISCIEDARARIQLIQRESNSEVQRLNRDYGRANSDAISFAQYERSRDRIDGFDVASAEYMQRFWYLNAYPSTPTMMGNMQQAPFLTMGGMQYPSLMAAQQQQGGVFGVNQTMMPNNFNLMGGQQLQLGNLGGAGQQQMMFAPTNVNSRYPASQQIQGGLPPAMMYQLQSRPGQYYLN